MRLHELFVREYAGNMVAGSSATDMVAVVRDMLVMMMADDVESVPTQEFQDKLADQGYNISTDEIIQAVSASGYASSVDANEIVPASELDPSLVPDEEELPDVGDMASDEAMSNIEDEL